MQSKYRPDYEDMVKHILVTNRKANNCIHNSIQSGFKRTNTEFFLIFLFSKIEHDACKQRDQQNRLERVPWSASRDEWLLLRKAYMFCHHLHSWGNRQRSRVPGGLQTT